MYYEEYLINLHFGRRNDIYESDISLMSGDVGAYRIKVNIIDYDGYEEELSSWVTYAEMQFMKSDGSVTSGSCDISEIGKGIVFYNLQLTDIDTAGIVIAAVQLTDSDNSGVTYNTRITSQKFQLLVVEDIFG